MKKLALIVAIGLAACAQTFAQQPPVDPNDAVLYSYKLTDDQEAQFFATFPDNTKTSAFWNTDWSALDYADLNTANNAYTGTTFSGPTDCEVQIRSAYSDSGLFMYFLVEDDIFVTPDKSDLTTTWGFDACDFSLDAFSSAQIKALPMDATAFVDADYQWAITYTTEQIQVWMLDNTEFNFQYYDPTNFDWVMPNVIAFTDAPATYGGTKMKIVPVDATHKAQEWYIPWARIGNPTGFTDPPPIVYDPVSIVGKRIAFAGGYNDIDAAGQATKRLRWQNGCDPYCADAGAVPPYVPSQAGLNSWGDIQFAAAGVGVHRLLGNNHLAPQVVKTELYNLRGQRVNVSLANIRNSVVLQRSILDNGTKRITMLGGTK